MPKFQIEQIAICPPDPEAAMRLLKDMGATDWIQDAVTAEGSVYGNKNMINQALLSFNYDIFAGKEFEVLNYTKGMNWMDRADRRHSVSHLGMHCTEAELDGWKVFFSQRNILIAQEVRTQEHTNAFLVERGRKYHYCIFDTRSILGVDLKFIVRIEP